MSMYGDEKYYMSKEYLYDEIKEFLEYHPISELLEIISDVTGIEKEQEEHK